MIEAIIASAVTALVVWGVMTVRHRRELRLIEGQVGDLIEAARRTGMSQVVGAMNRRQRRTLGKRTRSVAKKVSR